MSQSLLHFRLAQPQDAQAVSDCVAAAYAHWVPRIGQKPAPMLQDYAAVIQTEHVVVAEQDGEIAGVLVLRKTSEGFLLDNVAVLPSRRGQGVGKALLVHAEREARNCGYTSLYLYTHEKMTGNIALYARVGYVEVERREEDGFRRVFMRKALQPEADSTSASGVALVPVASIAHKSQAQALISEYLHWVAAVAQENYGLRFDVAAMAASGMEDASKFYPPAGRFYLVMHQGLAVGVGCLKTLAPGVGEVQRMYVQPHVRGAGAGRALVRQLIAEAKSMGFRSLRLESLKALEAAHGLYQSVGFKEIDPYSENSMRSYQPPETLATYRESAVFMELVLDDAPV